MHTIQATPAMLTFAYLDNITYVEVIFHSQHFFSIYLCISTLSMLKTVNMKQPISRGDFSCPRRILYYFSYCLCRSQKSALARASYVCFGYVYVLLEVRNLSNNGQKQSDITSFERTINTLFSAIKSIHCFDRKSHSVPIKCNDIYI